MSVHKWKHHKPTVTSELAGHWVVNTVIDLIILITGTWLSNVKGRSNAAHILFRPGSSELHRYVSNTYLFASTENAQAKVSVCKVVTGQAILFRIFF